MAAAENAVVEEVQERSVRDELLAARDAIEEREREPASSASEPSAGGERARGADGKFVVSAPDRVASGTPDLAAVSQEQPDPEKSGQQRVAAAAPAAAVGTDPQQTQVPGFIPAPNSWSHTAKAKWGGIDPEIRAEIAKREADIARGMSKVDEERSFAKEVQRITQPYEAAIRAAGGTVPQAIQSVLNTAYILQTADPLTKAREIAKVIQANRIDMNLVSQPQESNPQVAALQQRIAQLEGGYQQQTQMQQQAAEQQVMAMIDTFGRDPKNKYFHAVQADMGQLIGSGYAGTLEQAYEAAIWARPDIRAQQLSDQQAAAQAKQDAALKAQRARNKGLSVRGGPGGSPTPVSNPNSTVREDLEAAIAEAQGRI